MSVASGSSTSDSSDSNAGNRPYLLMGVEVATENKEAHCTPRSLKGGFISTWSPVMHIIAIVMNRS